MWQLTLIKLKQLHDTRSEMSFRSLYHATYEAEAIKLNQSLFSATGKNYTDFTKQEIEDICSAEAAARIS